MARTEASAGPEARVAQEGEAGRAIRLRPEDVVATVDGTAIRAKDIVVFAPAGEERGEPLSKEMFEFLRDRAIDRLLVTREAERRGIALGPEAEAELEKLAAQFHYGPEVIAAAAPEEARIAFEREEARGFLLLRALMESEGLSLLPFAEEGARSFEGEGGSRARPAGALAGRAEDEREIEGAGADALAAGHFARYAEARAQFLARLRGAARIKKGC